MVHENNKSLFIRNPGALEERSPAGDAFGLPDGYLTGVHAIPYVH
jgi:hypothetical protein